MELTTSMLLVQSSFQSILMSEIISVFMIALLVLLRIRPWFISMVMAMPMEHKILATV